MKRFHAALPILRRRAVLPFLPLFAILRPPKRAAGPHSNHLKGKK
jgi:hypothetical protein